MERLLYNDLLLWKDSTHRKPLIVRGVRQCGKTHLLKEFGRNNYKNTAYFSFEGNDKLQTVFEGDLDPARIVRDLAFRFDVEITEETLIIFDEIQFCNRALTSLKYFCENAPEYHVVCAGSLLGIMLSKPLSFPVGKVDIRTLRPMNFYEFLLASGKNDLCGHLNTIDTKEPLSDTVLSVLEELLLEYYCVGGMPEAVSIWTETKDMKSVESVHSRISDSYELDFAKHAPAKDVRKLSAIWNSIPAQLSKENRRFIFGHAVEGARARDLEDALQWLIDAGPAYKVRKITKPSVPLSAYSSETAFKLYSCDVGLMRTMAGVPAKSILFPDENYREFKGSLTENYVLTELMARNDRTPFYWASEGKAEVDFVIMSEDKIVPIEVKSETRIRAASLNEYIERYDPAVAVLISKKNVRPGDMMFLPLSLVWNIDRYLGT